MAVKVVFNPNTRIIEVKSGVTELDVAVDLYSDAKEDWKTDSTLNKIEFPFIPIGGNSLIAGQVAPSYFFLKYPWKIQTPGDGDILSVALNLYGLAEDGINSRTQAETFIVQAGDGLSVTNSDLPGFDSEMNKAVRYASYAGGVSLDVVNGTPGTEYPVGNQENPVDSTTDAVFIANANGFKTIFIEEDATLDANAIINKFKIIGHSHVNIDVIVETAADVTDVVFEECSISGVLDGGNSITNCVVKDLSYVNGHIHNSAIEGTISLSGNKDAFIFDCKQSNVDVDPRFDMGISGQNLVVTGFTGRTHLENMNGSNTAAIGLSAGLVILEDTVVSGIVHVSGTGKLVDSSGKDILTGTWNEGVTIINELSSPFNITTSVWADSKALTKARFLGLK